MAASFMRLKCIKNKCQCRPCNRFSTDTSIFRTCLGCRADSNFMATCSRVAKSSAS